MKPSWTKTFHTCAQAEKHLLRLEKQVRYLKQTLPVYSILPSLLQAHTQTMLYLLADLTQILEQYRK